MKLRREDIQAVVFDMDDTLYPEREFVRSGYQAVGRHLREIKSCHEPVSEWLWDRFLDGQVAGAFDALNDHFALALTPDDIHELIEVYRGHPPKITPHPGIDVLLECLAEIVPLGLISDGPALMQKNKLEALGLARWFCPEAIVFTGALGDGAGKPNDVGFLAARRALGVPHGGCVYVADNLAKDFIAPNRLGWQSVHLRLEGQVHAHKPAPLSGLPQHVVRSVAELAVVLLGPTR